MERPGSLVGAGCVHGHEPETRETEQAACRVEEEGQRGPSLLWHRRASQLTSELQAFQSQ